MRRIFAVLPGGVLLAVVALSACSGSSGPSQSQLAAEKTWQDGQGGKYLAAVAGYTEAINRNVDDAFYSGTELATAAALGVGVPSAYRSGDVPHGDAGLWGVW
jgi:hypothetical protein